MGLLRGAKYLNTYHIHVKKNHTNRQWAGKMNKYETLQWSLTITVKQDQGENWPFG